MKILWNDKDGGPESRVWCWGIEIKGLFSILLLKFGLGSREAFHTHAFNSISWLLTGGLDEAFLSELDGEIGPETWHWPSLRPIITRRRTFHRVEGVTHANWVLTFRGPWGPTWAEYIPSKKMFFKLKDGRRIVDQTDKAAARRYRNHSA